MHIENTCLQDYFPLSIALTDIQCDRYLTNPVPWFLKTIISVLVNLPNVHSVCSSLLPQGMDHPFWWSEGFTSFKQNWNIKEGQCRRQLEEISAQSTLG